MPFSIVRNDITRMKTDAIVNAANIELCMSGGVCGAIFTAAGVAELSEACRKIGYCDTGSAVITDGFKLEAKYVIHTPGPIWKKGSDEERTLLRSCYMSSLELAFSNGLESVAFPLISSGIFDCPKDIAIDIAIGAFRDFLETHDMDIYLVVFDKAAFRESIKYSEIKEYIDDAYAERYTNYERVIEHNEPAESALFRKKPKACKSSPIAPCGEMLCESMCAPIEVTCDESFSQSLLRLIDEKGMTDVETYKKANIDRKLFSKIRGDVNYKPKKTTAVAFAIALELDLSETNELLAKAGYVLSHSLEFDLIIEYFIKRKNYDMFEINEALFSFDQHLLGN